LIAITYILIHYSSKSDWLGFTLLLLELLLSQSLYLFFYCCC